MAYTTIDDPSAYFQIDLYTGNGNSGHALTFDGNSDMQPDLIWGAQRDEDGGAVFLFDSTRGTTKRVKTNADTEEQTRSGVTAFNSDGFTMGDHADSNANSETVAVWGWKCNAGTTSSNTDGNVTVTLQVNTTVGFSMGTWTSTGNTSGTIGHGLGATPDVVISKSRSDSGSFGVILPKYASNQLGFLPSTNAFGLASGINTVGSSTFTDGNGADSYTRVFYAWKSIQGFSKFGVYEGNGNADGTFIYTGFKPKWLLTKGTDNNGRTWVVRDGARNTFNPVTNDMYIDSNAGVENASGMAMDFLSNGFKMRGTSSTFNGSETYIYLCFAESPFVGSDGTPTTAR